MTADYAPLIYAVINAHAPTLALLTGGLYLHTTVKHSGINRTSYPSAYDSSGFLKPICYVKGRECVPLLPRGRTEQWVSQRQIIELYLQQDKDKGFDELETVATALFGLLEQVRVTRGKGQFNGLANRYADEGFNGAKTIKLELTIVGYTTGS
jgi:hypothetical protein